VAPCFGALQAIQVQAPRSVNAYRARIVQLKSLQLQDRNGLTPDAKRISSDRPIEAVRDLDAGDEVSRYAALRCTEL
jgi:hypothetical protein